MFITWNIDQAAGASLNPNGVIIIRYINGMQFKYFRKHYKINNIARSKNVCSEIRFER